MKFFQLLLLLIFLGCSQNSTAQTVYTTKTGEKYHAANCRYLKHSKKEITLEQAVNFGYQACSICKPDSNSEENTSTNSYYATPERATAPQQTSTQATASQCTGKTKAGKRCKRTTKNASGRCYQH